VLIRGKCIKTVDCAKELQVGSPFRVFRVFCGSTPVYIEKEAEDAITAEYTEGDDGDRMS
jgi:hypothetical protein